MGNHPHSFVPPHGSYRDLHSFRKAEIIYDLTFRFCQRFLSRGDRTTDQMVQAARSGKQNIAEGAQASGTSKEIEIKLVSVARASLQELLEDYHDYLRVRDFHVWEKNSKPALFVRRLGAVPGHDYNAFREFVETRNGEVVANIAICLIHQANYLLDRQILQLERSFMADGGIRERMARARCQSRSNRRNTRK